jgi:hypothetical protein
MFNLTVDFLKRACERNGFARERFEEKNIPSDISSISVLPFFGDFRTLLFLSGMFFHRFRLENKNSKYFIIASWPGLQGLFPYADEYWGINDQAHMKQFYEGAQGTLNKSSYTTSFYRYLNEFFRDVTPEKEIASIYNNGLTNEFFAKYTDTKIFLPFVPSASILGKDFNRDLTVKAGYKIFIWPSFYGKQWHHGESRNMKIPYEFWSSLIEFLLANNFQPVVWKNFFSYDMSTEFAGKCIFLNQPDVVRALAAMRATGCVLDIFNGLSRFAYYARCPFLSVDERSRFKNTRENEFDDLFGLNLPKKYIFSFSNMVTEGNAMTWNQNLFPSIEKSLNEFLPELNRDDWPSTGEFSQVLPYKKFVRKELHKKIGTRFIKVPKI